uniref:Metalloendopeptidase n=1 Tax=Ditylenchus dipsaci TaxID=166011 RepID=A0A915EJJ3_9BILA
MWPDDNLHGRMRNALRPDAQNRWIHYKDKKGNYIIPYIIAGKFTSDEHKIIHGAFDTISNNSCIRFQKKTSSQFDYVEIQNQRGEVMLESNEEATCLLHQTVVHELFHTIGLWHEQMRSDRDEFIKVHYENIPNAYYPQFKKVPPVQAVTYGVQYDYTSVMHYAKDAFAMVPGALTMQTKKKNAQNIIGNVKRQAQGLRGQKLIPNSKDKDKDNKKTNKGSKKNHRDHKKHKGGDEKTITIWRVISLNAQPTNLSQVANNNTSGTSSPVTSSQQSTSSDSDDSTFYDSLEHGLDMSSDTWKIDEEVKKVLHAANISLSGGGEMTLRLCQVVTIIPQEITAMVRQQWSHSNTLQDNSYGADDQYKQPDTSKHITSDVQLPQQNLVVNSNYGEDSHLKTNNTLYGDDDDTQQPQSTNYADSSYDEHSQKQDNTSSVGGVPAANYDNEYWEDNQQHLEGQMQQHGHTGNGWNEDYYE